MIDVWKSHRSLIFHSFIELLLRVRKESYGGLIYAGLRGGLIDVLGNTLERRSHEYLIKVLCGSLIETP